MFYDAKNYFEENNRTTSVRISKNRVHYQELQKNTQFSQKYILFCQRDINIGVSKKNGKEKI